MNVVKQKVGRVMALIGAALWEAGGLWKDVAHTENRDYEDLKWYGKLGYNMCEKGCIMVFGSFENVVEAANHVMDDYCEKAENL